MTLMVRCFNKAYDTWHSTFKNLQMVQHPNHSFNLDFITDHSFHLDPPLGVEVLTLGLEKPTAYQFPISLLAY